MNACAMVRACMERQQGNDPTLSPEAWALRQGPDTQVAPSGEVLREVADHGRDDYHRLVAEPSEIWGA